MQIVKCQICGSKNTEVEYKGAIRNGKFPNVINDAKIFKCIECEVKFLSNYNIDYITKDYRDLVDSDSSKESFYRIHDNDTYSKLSFIELKELRGKKSLILDAGQVLFWTQLRDTHQKLLE